MAKFRPRIGPVNKRVIPALIDGEWVSQPELLKAAYDGRAVIDEKERLNAAIRHMRTQGFDIQIATCYRLVKRP